MAKDTYLRCKVDAGKLLVHIIFDNTLQIKDIREEKGRWVADLEGVFLRPIILLAPTIKMKKIYLDGDTVDFDFDWSVLNRLPPTRLVGGPAPICLVREKGKGATAFN